MDILDLVFPKKCINCGKWGRGKVVHLCGVGGGESRYGLRHVYCKRPWSMEGFTCFWAYEGIAQKLIKQVKYRFYYDYLNELISCPVAPLNSLPEFEYLRRFLEVRPVVVPVPLWPKREKERGFNQAEIIAQIAGRQWALETGQMLVRTKDTGKQVGRTREERLEAVRDAFSITPRPPLNLRGGVNILLVDDVWTTGATMSECCRILKIAGVKKVWGLVLAR